MQTFQRLRRFAALMLPVALGVAASPCALAQKTQTANVQPFISLSASEVEQRPGAVRGDMLLANDDNIYFASSGGGYGAGAIGKVTPDGTLSVLFAISEIAQGISPFAKLAQGSDDHHLYGTTYQGGNRGAGVVFRVTLDGEYTVLHSFDDRDHGPFYPYTGVVEGPDGYLYGTTLRGGTNGMGTVYRISREGTGFSVIHHFSSQDSCNPEGTLVVGNDGLLYGTTMGGSSNNCGSASRGMIYRISTGGALERLYSFPSLGAFTTGGVATNQTGANPRAGLTLASDGDFYGTAYQGGAHGFGTVFRMSTAGVVSTVHDFTGPPFGGAFPLAGVTQGPDGAFYGTTVSGAYLDSGSVWRVDAAGNFSMLHGFTNSGVDGSEPHAGVLFAHDSLYAVSYSDGFSTRAGAILKLDQGVSGVLPVELSLTPTEMIIGGSVSQSWNAPGATECAKTGDWSGEAEASGAQSVTPLTPGVYVYAIRCLFEDGARIAYGVVNVKAPPRQPVDGGAVVGGGGTLPLLLLLLSAALLTRKFIKETVRPCP